MTRSNVVLTAVGLPVLMGAAYLLFWPVPIDPIRRIPSPIRPATIPVAPGSLRDVTQLLLGVGDGPEDIVRGPDGFLYCGFADGRIVRFRPNGEDVETVANTHGRPLGMDFDQGGNLIVADAWRGLLSVAPDGAITVLVDSLDGEPLLFPDDLDIAADGTIWFTDASRRFGQRDFLNDFWEGRATGRLLSYDPASHRTTVRLDSLAFGNGVALGPDDAWVLVNETMAARITRLWLKGPKAGTRDVFLEGLGGYPDNLSYDGRGTFWIALPEPRNAALERLWPHPILRKMLYRLPESMRNVARARYGWVLAVDTTGALRHDLRDPSGGYSTITSVNAYGDTLYLGSITMPSVGVFPVPPAP